MIISFSGPSGSGKTTLIKALKNLKVKGEDDFLIVKLAKFLFGTNKFEKYKQEKFLTSSSKNSFSLFALLVEIFYPAVIWAEYLGLYLYWEVFHSQQIIVLDRYFYDYAVTFKEILQFKSFPIDIYLKLTPRPSLPLLLALDVPTLNQRSKNPEKQRIDAQKELQIKVLRCYEDIGSKKKLIKISTLQTPQESLTEVKLHLLAFKKLSKIKRIALIGLDGVGKTTLAKKICAEAELLGLKCRIVHFYHENLVYRFLSAIGLWEKTSSKIKQSKTTFLTAFLRLADSYLQYLFFTLANPGRIIIFDRFFDDYLVNFAVTQVPGRSAFQKFLPSVDKKIILIAEATTARKRKPENTKSFFVDSMNEYMAYAQKKKIEVIDTTNQDQQLVFEQTISIL